MKINIQRSNGTWYAMKPEACAHGLSLWEAIKSLMGSPHAIVDGGLSEDLHEVEIAPGVNICAGYVPYNDFVGSYTTVYLIDHTRFNVHSRSVIVNQNGGIQDESGRSVVPESIYKDQKTAYLKLLDEVERLRGRVKNDMLRDGVV